MRTKAGETKRYSLRNIERRDFRSEEEVLASVCRESIKAYKEQNPDTPLWKHRRSISRRKKSIPKQNKKSSKQENIQQCSYIGESKPTSINFPSASQANLGNSSNFIEENLDDNNNEDNTSFNDDILNAIQSNKDYYYDNALLGDIMLNTALNHAIYCPASANCQVHECSRAKQFLIHWSTSTCIREDSYCQVCKSILMDLMVCTHVKTCEVSLFKCCPFPNCDKERVRVLGEWEKLKSKHKEMMDRIFGALKHVINCNDEKCTCRSLKLVINISNLILHTRNCIKSDSCKSRKFVISLCEHHQKTCTDENCDVEFCLENRKEKELNQDKEQSNSHEPLVQEPATSFDNNNQNSLYEPVKEGMPQTWTGMHAHQWNSNPINKNFSADNSSLFINSKFESISSPASFYNSNLQTCNKDTNQFENRFSGEFSTIDTTAIENTNDFKSNTYIFPESGIEKSQNDNFSDIDEHESDLCQSSTPIAATGNTFDGSNSLSTSPTKEMYYKLWSGKIESGKNVLPSLSPDDLKILSRATGSGDNRQLLSPVNDHRAAYSEISPFQPTTEFPALENSQLDDEFEEDPLYFPSCSKQPNETNTKTNTDDLFGLQAYFNSQGSKLKRRHYTESLAEWGKIDFVRQQLMEEIDVETETADESDDEPDANMEKMPVIAPMSKLNTPLPTSKFNRQTKQDAKSPLTNFERSYLEIMNEKKQTVHA